MAVLLMGLVQLIRTDGPVSLPCISVTASVVGSLDVVKADVLIGSDAVTGSGGVHLQYTDGGELTRVTFGNESSGADVSALSTDADDLKDHPSPHVRVTRDGADVTLTTDDGEV